MLFASVFFAILALTKGDLNGNAVYGNYEYRYFNDNHDVLNFIGATMKCFYYEELQDGILAMPKSSGENAAVATVSDDHRAWIGLGDFIAEKNFIWLDNTYLQWSNWKSGEPNNDDGEDCVETNYAYAGYWNDDSCCNTKGYVCQFPVQSRRRYDHSVLSTHKNDELRTFMGAKAQCAREGKRLLEITDDEDYKDVFRKLNDTAPLNYWTNNLQSTTACVSASTTGLSRSDCSAKLPYICEGVTPNPKVSNESPVLQKGGSVQVECSASGYPSPTVAWYDNDILVETQNIEKDRAILYLDNVQEMTTKVYTCRAVNEIGGTQFRRDGYTIVNVLDSLTKED